LILYEIWRQGLLRHIDREKLAFAFGMGTGPLALSRSNTLVRSISLSRAIFSPAYARALGGWLRYRLELYDGTAG
jgi:hypothetical protein